jgi:hypothetical protein
MTIDDIKHLFRPQIDEDMANLQFVIVEGETETVMTHPTYDLEGLVARLDGCTPAGYGANKTLRFHR